MLPEILEAARAGRFAFIDGGGQLASTTYVENLACAVEKALTRGRGGEAYFIADGPTQELGSFLKALARTHDVELPARSMPGWLLRPIARAVEASWSALCPSAKPPLSSFGIDMLSRSVTVSIGKARAELGYWPRFSVEEGLERTRQAARTTQSPSLPSTGS